MTQEVSTNDAPHEGLDLYDSAAAIEKLLDKSERNEDEDEEREDNTPADDSDGDSDENEDTSDEDAEDDEDDGEDDETESDEDQDDSLEEVPTYKVKVDGEEIDVPLDELIKGYSRTADYTRKTQQLSADRRLVEQQAIAAATATEAYVQRLEMLGQALSGSLPPDEMKALETEYVRVRQAQAANEMQQIQAKVAEEKELLPSAIPEWRNSAIAQKEKKQMLQYATSTLGFTPEEMTQVTDHRALVILRKAMLYDRITSKGKTVTGSAKKPTPTLRPGASQARASGSERRTQQYRKELRQTGSIAAATAAIKGLLSDD